MALNPSNGSNLEHLALKGLTSTNVLHQASLFRLMFSNLICLHQFSLIHLQEHPPLQPNLSTIARSPHSENTCSTSAWDEGAVTKTNDSFETLAYWASFNPSITVHQSLWGWSLVRHVSVKILVLAGRPNSTMLGLSVVCLPCSELELMVKQRKCRCTLDKCRFRMLNGCACASCRQRLDCACTLVLCNIKIRNQFKVRCNEQR